MCRATVPFIVKLFAVWLAVLSWPCGKAQGADFIWSAGNSENEVFSTGAWGGGGTGGTPGPADTAIFREIDTSPAYWVTFTNSPTNATLRVLGGDSNSEIHFALGGQTYTLTNGIRIGDEPGRTANLTLMNGILMSGAVTSSIGVNSGDVGNATVGADAVWSAGTLEVGSNGIGNLTVQDGGRVDANGVVGFAATSIGTVSITGPGSAWNNAGELHVADRGVGTTSVSNGGLLASNSGRLGEQVGSDGTVTVVGNNSAWMNSTNILVGRGGKGKLTISDGGRVTSDSLTVGDGFIGGPGSGNIAVGQHGTLFTRAATLGNNPGSQGTVTVADAGSIWSNSSQLFVGNRGNGSLFIRDGGTVTTDTALVGFIGSASVSVVGTGSNLRVTNELIVDAIGNESQVNIFDGGTIDVGQLLLTAGPVNLTGEASTLNSVGGIFVGGGSFGPGGAGKLNVGTGTTLNVGDRLKIWDSFGTTLNINGGTVNTKNFERWGTFNFNSGSLNVSGGVFDNGRGPTNLVLNGATASDLPTLHLSNNATTSDIANVTVGQTRRAAISVESNANFVATGPATLGDSAGSSGIANIDGGTWNNTGSLTVGSHGQGTLTIRNAGIVTSASAVVGGFSDGNGSVSVDGVGSQWNNGSLLIVGGSGAGTVTVSAGGAVSSPGTTLSFGTNSSAVVSIVGAGSSWAMGDLEVGVGPNAKLSVAQRGRLTSATSFFGAPTGGNANVSLTGAGTTWSNSGSAYLAGTASGAGGGTAIIKVESGAVADFGTANTDTLKIWNNGTLVIDGGTVNAHKLERLGTLDHRDGTLSVTGGQFVSAGPLTINGADADDLPTLALTGGASSSGVTTLTVGSTRKAALNLTGGAVLTTASATIGASPGASGVVSVTGGATRWTTAAPLIIGGTGSQPGGNGTLNIGLGGAVEVTSGLFGLMLGPQGTVNLDGGNLTLPSITQLGGVFNFNSGTLRFSSAGVTLDNAQLSALLGPQHVMSGGRTFLSDGVVTLESNLTVDGGNFAPGLLTNNSVLTLKSGRAFAGQALNSTAGTLSFQGGRLEGVTGANNGVIQGTGALALDFTNAATGRVRLSNNEQLRIDGAAHSNNGSIRVASGAQLGVTGTLANNATIDVIGATAEFTGAVTNAASTGVINTRDGTLSFAGGLNNSGSVAVTFGTTNVFGDVKNNAGGRVTLSGGSNATFYDDLINNGIVQVSAGSTAVFFGGVSGSGSFPGTGTVFLEGDTAPGSSPAKVEFGGDVVLGPASQMVMELAGTVVGSKYDQLDVTGSLSLAGSLDVKLLDGFLPAFGQSFDLLDFAALTGHFESVHLPALSAGLDWNTSELYTSGTITVVPEPATLGLVTLGIVLVFVSRIGVRRPGGPKGNSPGREAGENERENIARSGGPIHSSHPINYRFPVTLSVATLIVAGVAPQSAQAAKFLGLGDLPGGSYFSTALGVSADGLVVVGNSSDTLSSSEAFRWTSSGGMVGLGDLAGGSFSSNAFGVSADGSVVVGQSLSTSGFEAFRWTNVGGMVGLGDFAGGSFSSSAFGVSADGSVVAGTGDAASGIQAFRWTTGGGMVGLGDLPGGVFESRGAAVSADGSVVVGIANSATATQAFRWTSSGGMVGLGVLPDFLDSQAYGVSADGSVIVGGGNSQSGGEAFRWTSGGGMVGLGDLPGGIVFSQANSVSADGSTVVGYGWSASGPEAFIWDAANGMRSVKDVILPSVGAALDGWRLTFANAISADGRILVGSGLDQSGNRQAWLAYLPDDVYWSPKTSGDWDATTNWSGPFAPAPADGRVINPSGSLTVIGPSGRATVKSLTVGGGTGIATLRLQSGGSIQAINGATILSTGVLTGDGSIEGGAVNFGTIAADNVTIQGGLSNQGLIKGSGRVAFDLANATTGRVRVAGGEHLRLDGTAHSNDGSIRVSPGGELEVSGTLANRAAIDVIGGTAEFTGAVTNASTGAINARDSTLSFPGKLTNAGAVSFSFGTMDVFGNIKNDPGGRITVSGESRATFYGSLANNGGVQVSAGSTAVFFGTLSGAGVASTGTVFIEGGLSPGNSPAEALFGGDLVLGPNSHTLMELAGTLVGSQYDQIDVAGSLSLAGSLDVTLLDGFVPGYGQSFDLFDFDTLAGRFDSIRLPVLSAGLEWTTSDLYTNGAISVVPEPATLVSAMVSLLVFSLASLRKREALLRSPRS